MVETRSMRIHLMICDKWDEIESAENILADILSRLPVKSLLACKSVSKQWHRLICSQFFIDLQLSQSKRNPDYILYPFIHKTMRLYLVKVNGRAINMIYVPYFGNRSPLYMICSFDGLICCVNYTSSMNTADLDIYICNPATREVLLLPRGSRSEEDPSIGVAFGPKINEYKVFHIFCSKVNCKSETNHSGKKSEANHYECEVYSSSTRSWRGIGTVPNRPMRDSLSPLCSNHVFVGGKVYWFVSSEAAVYVPGSILSVDMDGNFRTISLPDKGNFHSFLIDLEGCLSLVDFDYNQSPRMVIWILEDCNEPKWEKKCCDVVLYPNDQTVVFVAACKREILLITSNGYLIYKLDFGTWESFSLNPRLERKWCVAFSYTKSLLSCGGRQDPET